ASLRWRHLMNARPRHAVMTLDGAPLRVDQSFRAVLPPLNPEVPHVIAAELEFTDHFIARRELVISGGLSDKIGSQLTPIAVRATRSDPAPSIDRCFSAQGAFVRTAAIEKPRALVVVVQDPDPFFARALNPLWNREVYSRTAIFGSDT